MFRRFYFLSYFIFLRAPSPLERAGVRLLFLFFISANTLSSQTLIRKKAEKHYQQLEYADALTCYQSIIKKGQPTVNDLRNSIECSMQLAQYLLAENYLRKLFQIFNKNLVANDFVNYINALKYNEHYNKADSLLKVMQMNYSDNAFMLGHKYQPKYINDLKIDSSNYHIKNLSDINTKYSDFSITTNRKDNLFYFSSNRRNTSYNNKKFAMDDSYFLDLYQSSKKDSIHFENTKSVKRIDGTKYHDGPVSFSYGGKTMYLTRSNYLNKKVGESKSKLVNLKLFILHLDTITNTWKDPKSFEYNSDEYSIGHATTNKEGTKLYFVSDMPGGFGKTDVYVSEWKSNKWMKPENLGSSINTEGREMFPYIHEDGTLFFSSDGRVGLGGLDVYFSAIQYDVNFEPQNIGFPINSSHDDFSFSLNTDLLTGYFSSNRIGGQGKDDLYYFKSKSALIPHLVSGIVKDEISNEILPFTKVYLYDKTVMRLDSFVVDTSGRYLFSVNAEHQYEIKTTENMMQYAFKKDSLSFNQTDNFLDVLITPKYRIAFKIIDSKTKLPLSNVNVNLKNNETKEITSFKTDKEGRFQTFVRDKKLGDKLSIELKLEKDEYITIVDGIDLTLDSNTVIELENPMEFNMEKIAKGVNLANVINLKPIYFDLAKWNVRLDAAIELNRIVKLMNENPTIKIELGSHTDCRSSDTYNLKLSTLRAKSAVDYLVLKGIDKKRMISKGYGETKSIFPCACEGARLPECSEEQHQLNRRTEFLIIDF